MMNSLLALLLQLNSPTMHGLFGTAGLYLIRVTAVEVPNESKLLGDTKFRIDEVLIGPRQLKGKFATYKFFKPRGDMGATMGNRYSGKYPDFAYPTPKSQSRYWAGKGGQEKGTFYFPLVSGGKVECPLFPPTKLICFPKPPKSPAGSTSSVSTTAWWLMRLLVPHLSRSVPGSVNRPLIWRRGFGNRVRTLPFMSSILGGGRRGRRLIGLSWSGMVGICFLLFERTWCGPVYSI